MKLNKGKRISGELREQVSAQFAERYQAGESIRTLAAESGRSYGFVQRLLKEAGVDLRSRGGTRRPDRGRATAQPAGTPPGADA
ncbi:MAG: helix-turn-helix domain-containing protein [Brooklawnia sp.]